jgi:hypothetical protein
LIGGFGISHAVGSVNFNNPNSKIIATEFANRLANAAYVTGFGAALLTLVSLAAWFVARFWRTRRRLRSSPAESASFA